MNSVRSQMIFRTDSLIAVVFSLGIVFSIFMQFQIRDDVFYGGDAGLKYLMVRQYAEGNFSVCLHLDRPAWIRETWDQGSYPFGPPFVYPTEKGPVVVFPFLFQLLSIPFYALFGYRGLYVIPVLSLWLLWWRFLVTCRILDLKPATAGFGLAAVVFASPLTLFGAIYWEHTLAVLLIFLGMEFVVRSWSGGVSPWRAALYGALSALAVGLRPETTLFVLPLLASFLFLYLRHRRRAFLFFLGGSVIVLGLLLSANQILYGHILGPRSLQLQSSIPVAERWVAIKRVFFAVQLHLFGKFPMTFAFLAAIPGLFVPGRRPAVRLLVGLTFVFLLTVAVVLPNDGGKQWGPRYLLIAFPVIVLASAIELQRLMTGGRRMVGIVYGIVVLAAFCVGLASNTYFGSRHLADDYANRIHPGLVELRHTDVEHIVAVHPYIVLELAAAHEDRTFFLARDRESLQKVASAFRENGVEEFLYLTRPGRIGPEGWITWGDDALGPMAVHLESFGVHGDYEFFRGRIRSS